MKKYRLMLAAVLTSLCMVMVWGADPVQAAQTFSAYDFNADTGVLTVHSSVPDEAVWDLDDNSVKEIIFEDGVKTIGKDACGSSVFGKLAKMTFAPSVREIGDRAFTTYGNPPKQEIVFSEGLEKIGEYAFSAAR
ncbi:MAG: leucine-rich repeat protein [Firmicutes bacterium]|nr:leucine-rich repeat protein [Bacillota bacterium]